MRDIASRPGVWKRSGQIASIVGLDYPAALALVPRGADLDQVKHLLGPYEAGLIVGSVASARRNRRDDSSEEEG